MKKKVYIFGTGYYGLQAYYYFRDKTRIEGFIDNDVLKCGKQVFGKTIFQLSEIKDKINNETEILIGIYDYLDVCKQLEKNNISSYVIVIDGHVYDKPKYFGNKSIVKRCCRCVMDNKSDPKILFDEYGYCNYCNRAIDEKTSIYYPGEEGKQKLYNLLSKIKSESINKKYDCIMGVSGGLDSSYLLYLGYKWGLKVLAVHIDDGYDTEISKNNINKLIKKTGFDYEAIRPDSEQYNDLTLAYMKAGVPNIAVPQDNILLAFLYRKMKEYDIKYFLSGGNFALECILQKGNTHSALDVKNLYDIYKKFGRKKIDKLEFISSEQMESDRIQYGMQSPRPLNYVDYNRKRALKELKEFCEFEYYGRKHLENILTAFAQLYWFPKKFDVDKRTSHLSSMIVSNQLTREEALIELNEPLYNEEQMKEYISIIRGKMQITENEFDEIMRAPSRSHEDYVVED